MLTPEIKAFFGVFARFRKVFSINEKVCAGPGGPLDPPGLRMADALDEVRQSIQRNLDAKKGGSRGSK